MKSTRGRAIGALIASSAFVLACANQAESKGIPTTASGGAETRAGAASPAEEGAASPPWICVEPAVQVEPSASGLEPGFGGAGAAAADRAFAEGSEGAPASKGVRIDGEGYTLSVDVPAEVASGAEGAVRVTVQPKSGWKLNQEFPTKLTVVAPSGVTLKKAKLRKGDAAHFSEKKGAFEVKFTATEVGDKDFRAKFKFAVCTDKSCDPKTEKLAWTVTVE
jgi:hypothetical protein